ncbi:MAG: 30S ribosomal protein S20 [Bacteroidales bacterium]
MANHKSSLKRIRSDKARQLRNRYYGRTMRNAIKKFRSLTDKEAAQEQFPKIVSLIDKNAKRSIIHRNKAANLKSKMAKKLATLS